MKRTSTAIALVLVAGIALVAGCSAKPTAPPAVSTKPSTPATSSAATSSTPTTSAPTLQPLPPPGDFVAAITNPWWPLAAGNRWLYRGFKDGRKTTVDFLVTKRKKVILGIPATVVTDILSAGGKPVEVTEDWYAQDKAGNVWYLGEATKELDAKGSVTSTEGSWQAGVNGAKPGIYMPASPQVGQSFQMEYYAGHAGDQFTVVSLTATATVPAGSFTKVMLTDEVTRLEPGVVTRKAYVRGMGVISEDDIKGAKESNRLVKFTPAK